MRFFLITTLSMLIGHIFIGQEEIDFNFTKNYNAILKLTKDKNSTRYYGTLLERFQKVDTTLKNHEMVALQIGDTDSPKYVPIRILN